MITIAPNSYFKKFVSYNLNQQGQKKTKKIEKRITKLKIRIGSQTRLREIVATTLASRKNKSKE